MHKVIDDCCGRICVNMPDAIRELRERNCCMPDITRVIFNVGKKSYPKLDENGNKIKDEAGKLVMADPVDVLATVLYFCDGSKVAVVNSQNDGIEFSDEKLSDGTTVKVASKESKERGIVYAIVKRLLSKIDSKSKTGLADAGFGRYLNKLLETAYDEQIERAEVKIAKAKSKAAHVEAQKAAEARGPKKRYSIAETLTRFNQLLDKVENGSASPSILSKVANIFKD